VIVCAYTLDRWKELRAAVDAIAAQTMAPQETILAVDGNEQLYELARAELPGVRVVMNDGTPGLSSTRSVGARSTDKPVLVYLDDDARPEPNWLAELMKGFEDERVLGVGGAVIPDFVMKRPRWLAPEFDWVVGCSHSGMPVNDAVVRNLIGANMSIRASVLEKAGDFAETMGRIASTGGTVTGAAEETELAIRAARLNPGHYWLYRPDARVHHSVPASRTTWRYYVKRCKQEGAAKAKLVGLEGSRSGLDSERSYVRSVLPRALIRELRRGLRGDLGGFACAGAICVGVLITTAAYVAGRVRSRI
jgi:GT2 family glycosyltransferase